MREPSRFLARLRRISSLAGLIGIAEEPGPLCETLHGEGSTAVEAVVAMDWRNVCGRAPGLAGLSGRIALEVGEMPVGALKIDSDGAASVGAGTHGAAATITVDSEDTLIGLLRGHLPPIVMELRGRLRIAGDARFALQALYGLQAGSPWAAAAESRGA